MSRAFFADVRDALTGFLPREFRDLNVRVSDNGIKVWRTSWHEHFEVQHVSAAVLKAAGEKGGPGLEVGFHAEHPKPEDNDEVVALLEKEERAWRRAIGTDPVLGPFVGRREQRARWRRLSELWLDGDLDDDGTAVEAADRLAGYVRAIVPALERPPPGRCFCWKART